VADDHKLLRAGIIHILTAQANIDVIAEAADGLTAIAATKRFKPDFLTLDIAMPYAQGLAVYAEVKRWSPDTRVVVFTGVTSSKLLSEIVNAGVHGLFTKRGDIEEFERAIPIILNGGKVISPDAAKLIDTAAETQELTARERQILSLICNGQSTKGIAAALSVSTKTVDNHRTNIMSKLNVRSLAELLAYALREGLLDAQREL
jgi:DNA-binding NarL/FixJ family response regulator